MNTNGVEAFLKERIPEFGYAVDVGANDGVFESNTLWLEQKGWIVLCVEANPLLAEKGRMNRKLWRPVAASDFDSDSHTFTMYGPDSWASYSSLGERSRYGHAENPQAISVPVRRVDRLLEEAGFPQLDLLTIDTEGWEQEVIRGACIDVWMPKWIIYEDYMGRYEPPAGYAIVGSCVHDKICERQP